MLVKRFKLRTSKISIRKMKGWLGEQEKGGVLLGSKAGILLPDP